jgi:hypothetical protein
MGHSRPGRRHARDDCLLAQSGHELAQTSRPIAAHKDGYRPYRLVAVSVGLCDAVAANPNTRIDVLDVRESMGICDGDL